MADDDSTGSDDPGQNQAGVGGADQNQQNQDPGRTFTQAEVDAMIKRRADRVAQERFGDYDQLKERAKKADELEAATATELERAAGKAKAEGRTEVIEAANRRIVLSEARALAAQAKFRNPQLAVKAIDLSNVKVNEDGDVDAAAITALLDGLAKDEPYLIDAGDPPKARAKVDEGQGQTKTRKGLDIGSASGRELLRDAYTTPK